MAANIEKELFIHATLERVFQALTALETGISETRGPTGDLHQG